MKIAVAGATGYIGGRLVPRLIAEGHEVVCLARNPGKLDGRPWQDLAEVRYGDVGKPESLVEALAGCEVAYYLVHSMGARRTSPLPTGTPPRPSQTPLRRTACSASSTSAGSAAPRTTCRST